METFPTAQRWARCVEMANRMAAVNPDSPSCDPTIWWGSTLPVVRPLMAQRQEYWQSRQEKRNRHSRMHRRVDPTVRREVMASGVCSYCGNPAEVVDHIVPVARGGTRFRRNLAAACWLCNSEKSDMTLGEWMDYRARLALSLKETAR